MKKDEGPGAIKKKPKQRSDRQSARKRWKTYTGKTHVPSHAKQTRKRKRMPLRHGEKKLEPVPHSRTSNLATAQNAHGQRTTGRKKKTTIAKKRRNGILRHQTAVENIRPRAGTATKAKGKNRMYFRQEKRQRGKDKQPGWSTQDWVPRTAAM